LSLGKYLFAIGTSSFLLWIMSLRRSSFHNTTESNFLGKYPRKNMLFLV